jgi:hypothetical protein
VSTEAGKPNDILEAALAALARGWSVMPISRTSKSPIVKWTQWQTHLPPESNIRHWFGERYPDCNLGIITGTLSGFVILDVDDEEGHEEIKRRGGLPDTVTVRTSADWKLHYYFKHPGFEVRNFQKDKNKKSPLPGLDFRGDGGYAMLPPSLHERTQQAYRWIVSPDQIAIAEMPGWFRDFLWQRKVSSEEKVQAAGPVVPLPKLGPEADSAKRWAMKGVSDELAKIQSAGKGERHQIRYNATMAIAGWIPSGILSEQEVRNLVSINFGDSEKKARETIEDAIRDGMAKPRSVPAHVLASKPGQREHVPHPADCEDAGAQYHGGGHFDSEYQAGQDDHQEGSRDSNPDSTREERPTVPVDNRPLEERQLTVGTLKAFDIAPVPRLTTAEYFEFPGYKYPTVHSSNKPGRPRYFSADLERTGGQRYHTAETEDNSRLPVGYNLYRAAEQLRDGAVKTVWVTTNELCTWYCHQAGILAVNPFNYAHDPGPLLKELKKLGATKLELCFGNVEDAEQWLIRWIESGERNKVKVTVRGLPGTAGLTLAEYRERCKTDAEFSKALSGLPVIQKAKLQRIFEDNLKAAGEKIEKPEAGNGKAEFLLEMLTKRKIEVFRGEDDTPYVVLPRETNDGKFRNELYDLKGSKFGSYCRYIYQQEKRRIIEGSAVENVAKTLEGQASFEGAVHPVHLRTGEFDDGKRYEFGERRPKLYIDLCNDDWQVVEIDPWKYEKDGWRVIQNPSSYFRRTAGMLSLPVPQRGGNWNHLREIVNVGSDQNWIMYISWLIAALRPPNTPYPALSVHGEEESGKTFLCRVAKTLVDPNYTPFVSGKNLKEEQLAMDCFNNMVIAVDNLSSMSQEVSDALATLVTEGGFRKRAHYANTEQVLFKGRRPIVLNGINENMGGNDFRRRCVKLFLPSLKMDPNKREEDELKARLEEIHPYILGLICDAHAMAMLNLPGVVLPHKRGLIDFSKWIMAAAADPALPFTADQFAETYLGNIQDTIDAANEADAFTAALLQFMSNRVGHKCTAAEWGVAISSVADEKVRNMRDWPKSPNQVGEKLNRVMANVRQCGFEIIRHAPSRGMRYIEIKRIGATLQQPAMFGDPQTEPPHYDTYGDHKPADVTYH